MIFVIQYFGFDSYICNFLRKRCQKFDVRFVDDKKLQLSDCGAETLIVCVYDSCTINDCGLRANTLTVNASMFFFLLLLLIG
jgi:hypothetical protein